MSKENTVTKYLGFANELLDRSKSGPITNVYLTTSRWKNSPSFFTFLVKRSYFTKLPGSKRYVTSIQTPFTRGDIRSLIRDFNKQRKAKKVQKKEPLIKVQEVVEVQKEKPFIPEMVQNVKYAKDEILINELKSRGFTGTLHGPDIKLG